MENNNNFNSWSFFVGIVIGMIIRSTDMLPMLGGLLMGVSIARVPDFIVVEQFPETLQYYTNKIKNFLNDGR